MQLRMTFKGVDWLGRSVYQVFFSQDVKLVVETTHLKKYARQIGSFPQVGVNIRNIWNHHLDVFFP